jgi:FkbM family methyltransferase
MSILRRVGFARDRATFVRPIRQDPVSAFLFFFLAGAGRRWRFHLGPMAFYARYRDWVAVEEIALHDEYGFVKGLLRGMPTPCVVDLGAHIGLFSLAVLRSFPSAVVHSVEASRDTYDILRLNSTINGNLAWHVHWAAMWSRDGEVPFVDEQKASTAHHVDLSGVSTAPARVPALSLTTLLREQVRSNVDLLKVDIEGAEEAVLCENPALLQSVNALMVEIHPDLCDQQRVMSLLRETYEYVYSVKGRGSSKPLVVAARSAVTDAALATF